ncbi:LEPR-XLL domain-containing protein [Rhodoblastus sp.]|uniref:LEPR-XLL domain-containing protein n=1 Tax=Rhodoblastus sp. TaxID=1962975 RepID=UPI003F9DE098
MLDPRCRPRRSTSDRRACSPGAHSCRLRQQFRQPHQIVGGGCEGEGPADPFTASEPRLLLSGDGLDPAEAFLDLLAER